VLVYLLKEEELKMGDNNLLLTLAVVAVAVSVVAAGFTYFSIVDLSSKISGLAAQDTAQTNLTVEEVAAINFTVDFIDWGSGRVDLGQSSASLTTFETNNVTNGNWTLQTAGGLRLENIGAVNVTLNLTSLKSAATFLGGTNPAVEWNVTNSEANSCLNASGQISSNLDVFTSVSTTTTNFCGILQFGDSNDEIRIDFNLTVPSDSFTGALTNTITATAESA